MNLFLARLTGKLMTTEKFEQHIRQLIADQKRYREVEQSPELKEYFELEKTVSSVQFQEKKKELLTKKYKDTPEYKAYAAFLRLQKDKTVKRYLAAKNDEERNRYTGTVAVKDYLKAKSAVEAEGFEQKRLFWANKNRWKQTDECHTEERFLQLKANPDIQFFLHAPVKRIEEMEKWEETYKAPFHTGSLKDNQLSAGFWLKNPSLRRDFSLKGEAQAYVGEQNLQISNDCLSILTRKQQAESVVWDEKIGFRPQTFPYTSAIATSGDFFQQEDGLFMVKVRANGKCHSAITLANESGKQEIELFHFDGGHHIILGTADGKKKNEYTIRGARTADWCIISVNITRKQIVWMLNEREVFSCPNPMAGQPLHFVLRSFAPAQKGGEGQMDIDWLRAFCQK